jgi:hypothetical protein
VNLNFKNKTAQKSSNAVQNIGNFEINIMQKFYEAMALVQDFQ